MAAGIAIGDDTSSAGGILRVPRGVQRRCDSAPRSLLLSPGAAERVSEADLGTRALFGWRPGRGDIAMLRSPFARRAHVVRSYHEAIRQFAASSSRSSAHNDPRGIRRSRDHAPARSQPHRPAMGSASPPARDPRPATPSARCSTFCGALTPPLGLVINGAMTTARHGLAPRVARARGAGERPQRSILFVAHTAEELGSGSAGYDTRRWSGTLSSPEIDQTCGRGKAGDLPRRAGLPRGIGARGSRESSATSSSV